MQDEKQLIARVAADGDTRAYSKLVRAHQSSVRAFLVRLARGNRALADDLAQETFIKAYDNIRKYSGKGGFEGWLVSIAYRLFLDLMKKEKRRAEIMEESGGLDFEARRQADRTTAMDVQKAVDALPQQEKTAITLCFNMGYSHAEAADIMNMPVGTVKSHIARGKDRLKGLLASWTEKVHA